MGSDTAFWGSVVAIAPLLALAAVVELRLTRWHRFSPFSRWALGFFGGLVLIALGSSICTALLVLQRGSAEAVAEWWKDAAYWSVYLGVWGVILLPVSQLWIVVFADLRHLRVYLKSRSLDREAAKIEREFAQTISEIREQRRWVSELIYRLVIARPEGVFVATGDGGYHLHITDGSLIQLRRMAGELDQRIRDAEKTLRKARKKFRGYRKKELKLAGRATARATKRLESYQGVWTVTR